MGKEVIRFLILILAIFIISYIIGVVYGKDYAENSVYRAPTGINPSNLATMKDLEELSKRVERLELDIEMLKKRRTK